jgi:hypothetical protein
LGVKVVSSEPSHWLEAIDLEIEMTLFSPTVLYPPVVTTHDRLKSSDIAFGVWAAVILIALATLSVALGMTPVVDPEACFGC